MGSSSKKGPWVPLSRAAAMWELRWWEEGEWKPQRQKKRDLGRHSEGMWGSLVWDVVMWV